MIPRLKSSESYSVKVHNFFLETTKNNLLMILKKYVDFYRIIFAIIPIWGISVALKKLDFAYI